MIERLKSERKARGFTLGRLAELSGVSKTTIHELENSKSNPSVDIAVKLAHALGLTIGELISEPPLVTCPLCLGAGRVKKEASQ